jgi:hypothetical protein
VCAAPRGGILYVKDSPPECPESGQVVATYLFADVLIASRTLQLPNHLVMKWAGKNREAYRAALRKRLPHLHWTSGLHSRERAICLME